MVQSVDCVHEAQTLYAEDWKPDEIARGDYWMEITWRHEENEDLFMMMVYGKENIELVAGLLESKMARH